MSSILASRSTTNLTSRQLVLGVVSGLVTGKQLLDDFSTEYHRDIFPKDYKHGGIQFFIGNNGEVYVNCNFMLLAYTCKGTICISSGRNISPEPMHFRKTAVAFNKNVRSLVKLCKAVGITVDRGDI